MYVNTTAEVKAETDYCVTSSNAVAVVEHIYREHGEDTEILFGPDMFLGAYVEKTTGRPMHVWDGECHVHAGIRPRDIADDARRAPGRRLPDPPRVRLLDLGDGVRRRRRRRRRGRPHALDRRDARLRARRAAPGTTAIVATETGMLHPLREAAPDVDFIAANEAAQLPLHEDDHAAEAARRAARRRPEVKVPDGDRRARARCRSSAWSRSASAKPGSLPPAGASGGRA